MSYIETLGKFTDPTIDISFDTLFKNKQALIFCNSKRSAEKTAEDIAKKIKSNDELNFNFNQLKELSLKILNVLGSPTKQCKRLAYCIERGMAFHHSGLHPEQRKIIEDAFREGIIKIISSTPTLAAGLDMPAYRTIIKDLRRFSNGYYDYIPVLEYHQMAGRAGRPGKEDKGQAIVIAKDEYNKGELLDKYLFAPPEPIYSKLAVEPVLRTYILSLICSRVIKDEKSLLSFFEKTFWAHQYGDMEKLEYNLLEMVNRLEEWRFIEDYYPTRLGMRISQLYLDPMTASELIKGIKRTDNKVISNIGFLQLISSTIEMKPYFSVRTKEFELIEDFFVKNEDKFLGFIPSTFDYEYETFMRSLKISLVLLEWIDEKEEQYILEEYNIRPGEIVAKKNIADWLLYSLQEISRILGYHSILTPINKLRKQLQYGIKNELLALIQFKNIGRKRARMLFNRNIKSIDDVKNVPIDTLKSIVGEKLALDLKKQTGR